jgi:hypothetical protein
MSLVEEILKYFSKHARVVILIRYQNRRWFLHTFNALFITTTVI